MPILEFEQMKVAWSAFSPAVRDFLREQIGPFLDQAEVVTEMFIKHVVAVEVSLLYPHMKYFYNSVLTDIFGKGWKTRGIVFGPGCGPFMVLAYKLANDPFVRGYEKTDAGKGAKFQVGLAETTTKRLQELVAANKQARAHIGV